MTDFTDDEPVPLRPLRPKELLVACQHCGHDLITTRSNFRKGHRYHKQCYADERREKGLHPVSEETKKHLSRIGRSRRQSPEAKKKNSESHLALYRTSPHHMCGKKHSPETKNKISEALRGEKNHMFGKKQSPETRKKNSEAHRGEKHPQFGTKHSPERKRKSLENNPQRRPVINITTGEVFPSMTKTGIKRGTLMEVIRLHRWYNGCLWRYAEVPPPPTQP